MDTVKFAGFMLFLSTLSLRRATLIFPPVDTSSVSISIHALLAESDVTLIWDVIAVMTISIHALLAESDWIHHTRLIANTISIHALLAESDVSCGFRCPK